MLRSYARLFPQYRCRRWRLSIGHRNSRTPSSYVPVMWTTLLGTLLLLGLAQAQFAPLEQERDDETANAETPYYMTLHSIIKKILLEQQEYFNERLQTLESKIEETCVNRQIEQQQSEELDIEGFTIKLADLMNTFVDKVSEVADTAVSNVEDKLDTLSSEVLSGIDNKVSSLSTVLVQMQQQMSTLVTKDQLVQLGSNISALTDTTVEDVKGIMSTLATESLVSSKLQQLADGDLTEIKNLLTNLNEEMATCPNDELLNNILTSVVSSREERVQLDRTLQEIATKFSLLHSQNAQSMAEHLQGLLQEVEQNERALTGVNSAVTNLETDMKARLTMLQSAVEEINNNTQVPPPTTTTTTTTTTTPPPTTTESTLMPCLDSIFRGSVLQASVTSTGICSAAIRFKKCHLQFVSYHCCQSCTEAGEIPPMGPWRYLNYPREVNILQALRLMRS